MANPQKENGYTAIANEIMEALSKTRIAGEARQVLDFILRKTYGFNKPQDRISLSQFYLGTGLKKTNIIRALKHLKSLNIIIIKKDNPKGNMYRFNKDYTVWKPLPKKITLSKKITSVIKKDNKSLSKKLHTKVDNTKETITKVDKGKRFSPPTYEDILKYCKERKNNVDAKKFYDFFTVSNWVDSKGNKVKNWKQKVITWEKYSGNDKKKEKTTSKYDNIGKEV